MSIKYFKLVFPIKNKCLFFPFVVLILWFIDSEWLHRYPLVTQDKYIWLSLKSEFLFFRWKLLKWYVREEIFFIGYCKHQRFMVSILNNCLFLFDFLENIQLIKNTKKYMTNVLLFHLIIIIFFKFMYNL